MAWKALILIIFTSFLLVACSSATPPEAPVDSFAATGAVDNPEPAASSAVAEPTSPAIDTLPAVSSNTNAGRPQGGKLVRLYRDPPTMDPHLTTDNISGGLVNEIFGGLVTLGLDLKVVPDLAERWDVSDDGRVYTFHLRKDAKFHDGKPVTAEDVRWSLERVADPNTLSPVAEQYLSDIVGVSAKLAGQESSISGLQVVDQHTIRITIDEPKSYFLAKLTYPTAFILDQKNVEGDGDEWLRQPNGTGPFKLAEYEIGEVLRLVRNEYYHLGPPNLDEVEFILAGGNAMIMYENDEIHLTGVGLADLERVLDPSEPLNAELKAAPSSFGVSYIGLNVDMPPLDDPLFRQALSMAIDRDTIAVAVLDGLRIPATTIIPPGFPSYSTDVQGYGYDPERALEVLKLSKYGNDLDNLPRITLSISGSFGADVPLDLEVILQSWQEVLGVEVEIQQTEWATFLQDLQARRYHMFTLGWSADYADPENFLDILFHSGSENNHTNYSSPQVDDLLEQARVEPDQETRFELYNRIEQMILDDAPWVLLWNTGETYALVKPEVKGYELTPMTIPKYRYVYLEAQ
jgi:oligopeptide transport system substrate-binding protein